MTYPWSSGDVLNAADLNAFPGWILSDTVTPGSGVSSVSVTLTGFDNYCLVWDAVDVSGNALILMDSPDLTASSWYSSTALWNQSAIPTTYFSTATTNCYAGLIDVDQSALVMYVYNPNNAVNTRFHSQGSYSQGVFTSGGMYAATTTTDTLSFTLTSARTFTGGTIYVMGRNNG